MTVDLATVIGILLSAGGGAFLLAVVRGIRDLRAGARAGQREVVQDLIEWREDLERQRRDAASDRDFWRGIAADRGYQLRQAGIEPRATNPVPPSERRPVGRPPRRRRLAAEPADDNEEEQ